MSGHHPWPPPARTAASIKAGCEERNLDARHSFGLLYEYAERLERENAALLERVKFLEDGHTDTSSHLIKAGIPAFGWNWEGVDKLAADRDYWKARAVPSVSGDLQETTELLGRNRDGWMHAEQALNKADNLLRRVSAAVDLIPENIEGYLEPLSEVMVDVAAFLGPCADVPTNRGGSLLREPAKGDSSGPPVPYTPNKSAGMA